MSDSKSRSNKARDRGFDWSGRIPLTVVTLTAPEGEPDSPEESTPGFEATKSFGYGESALGPRSSTLPSYMKLKRSFIRRKPGNGHIFYPSDPCQFKDVGV